MASLNQIKNMTWYLRGSKSERAVLIKRLHNLDQDITQVEYDINEAWASQFENPTEHVKDSGDEYDEYEEYDCPLRKRKTKKIGKGIFTLKNCMRKRTRDYRDKKRVKESRSRKRTKRSPTQLKGERDYGVNDAITENALEYEEEEYQQPVQKDDENDPFDDKPDVEYVKQPIHDFVDIIEFEEKYMITKGFMQLGKTKFIMNQIAELMMNGKSIIVLRNSNGVDAWVEQFNKEVLKLTALW